MLVEVGKIVEGKVAEIKKYGAFVELEDGKVGLVHISEVSDKYVKEITDYLEANQVVKVKIIAVDDRGKIKLSIKKAIEVKKDFRRRKPVEAGEKKVASVEMSFEDRLSKFLKDSDEKLSDLKRNSDQRRSGYRKTI